MLPGWIVFVVIALVAAVSGTAGHAGGAAGRTQGYFLFFIGVTALLVVARVLDRVHPWKANPARILAGIWSPVARVRGF